MYAGSYSVLQSISGITILGGLAWFMVLATFIILPIYMACRFNCQKKGLIILSNFIPFIGWILCTYLIAKDKKQSKFFEDTGKNNVRFHIIMYALNILALFTSMAKVRHLDSLEIYGITKFNLSFFLGKKDDLIGNLINKDDYKITLIMIWIFIIISIIGLIVNLIIKDARKPLLIMVNTTIQMLNASIIFMFAGSFDNPITKPGIAFFWESLIIICFVVSLYITVSKTSYVDN